MKNVYDERIKTPCIYEDIPSVSKEYVENAIQFVVRKVDENLEVFTDKFPAP